MTRLDHTSVVANRRQTSLNFTLEKKLFSYALVAGIAGVSALALTQPAEAKVVFTPAHQSIPPFSLLPLDLNHDGFTDVSFSNFNFATHVSYPGSYGSVNADALKFGNQIVATSPSQYAYGAALNSGVMVSANANFRSLPALNLCRTNPSHHTRFRRGPWINVNNKFVGIKFSINSETHFGWARLSMKQQNYCETFAVLTGYAYETVANKPIITGKSSPSADAELPLATLPSGHQPPMLRPANLGLLSLGAPGLAIWRKEDEELAGSNIRRS